MRRKAGNAASRPVARRSADRRRVLEAALRPQRVEAAGDLERRARADIALEDLAVIADRLDDVVRPSRCRGRGRCRTWCRLPPSRRLISGLSEVFISSTLAWVTPSSSAFEQREVHPLDDVEPLVVALADDRAERLLGDDLRQHDVIVRVRRASGGSRRGPTGRSCRRRSGRSHRPR